MMSRLEVCKRQNESARVSSQREKHIHCGNESAKFLLDLEP